MAISVVLYGPPILEAIAKGDLRQMKKLVPQAEKQLKAWGDLRSALEILRVEIAKLETKQVSARKKK